MSIIKNKDIGNMQTKKVIQLATTWYNDHKDHVDKLKKSTILSYEPSKSDLYHPELWKGASWNWFETLMSNFK
jgi:hypothetical protein